MPINVIAQKPRVNEHLFQKSGQTVNPSFVPKKYNNKLKSDVLPWLCNQKLYPWGRKHGLLITTCQSIQQHYTQASYDHVHLF